MELTIYHTENVWESRSAASLNNPDRTCNAFGQTALSCDLLSNFTTMERGAGWNSRESPEGMAMLTPPVKQGPAPPLHA